MISVYVDRLKTDPYFQLPPQLPYVSDNADTATGTIDDTKIIIQFTLQQLS